MLDISLLDSLEVGICIDLSGYKYDFQMSLGLTLGRLALMYVNKKVV